MPTRSELQDHFDQERDKKVHEAAAARAELRRKQAELERATGGKITDPQGPFKLKELEKKLQDADAAAKEAMRRAAEYKRTHPQ